MVCPMRNTVSNHDENVIDPDRHGSILWTASEPKMGWNWNRRGLGGERLFEDCVGEWLGIEGKAQLVGC